MTTRNDTRAKRSTKVPTQQLTHFCDSLNDAIALHDFFYDAVDNILKEQVDSCGYRILSHQGLVLFLRLLRERDADLKVQLQQIRQG